MKKILLAALLAISLLGLIGCNAEVGDATEGSVSANQPTDEQGTDEIATEEQTTEEQTTEEQDVDDSTKDDVENEIVDLTYETIEYYSIQEDQLRSKIEQNQQNQGVSLIEHEGEYYLVVYSGEKMTGGYGITIDGFVTEDDILSVMVTETSPNPDDMVTQAITYPLVVVKLSYELTEEPEMIVTAAPVVGTDEENFYVSPTDHFKVGEIITIGEIMAFQDNRVHIISGDLVEVFSFDGSRVDEFYLGQSVQLVKGQTVDELQPYQMTDFSMNYTNMGTMLETITGSINEIDDDYIVIQDDAQTLKIITFETQYLELGSQVIATYGEFGEGPSLVMLLNEDTKLSLTVTDIRRSDDGEMLISAVDDHEGAYELRTIGVRIGFNMSELLEGDVINVYHEGIMESYPMQVMTTMISQ